jgi:hypothetical protein
VTFHLSGKVNYHNLIILGSTPNCQGCARQSKRECLLWCQHNRGLQIILFRKDYHYRSHILKHAGALLCSTAGCKHCDLATRWGPFHCHTDVTWYLNQIFPGRWIGHGGYIPWPPRSLDLTSIDFSFWGFVTYNVYTPPMPVDLQELCDRTVNTVLLIDATFLKKL